MSFNEHFRNWSRSNFEIETERSRVAFLNQPIPRDINDPRLFEKVLVMVFKPFFVSGRLVKEGETVSIEKNLADSLKAIGKCEIL